MADAATQVESQEVQTPASAATPAAEPAKTDSSPVVDYKAEFEKLQGKYKSAQDDLNKFRTRQQEVEAAQKKADEERLKNAPLEERLKALEAERDEFGKKSGTLEAELKSTQTQLTLLRNGVDPEKLDDASALYERSLQNLKDGEELDLANWIKDRSYLLPQQAEPTKPTETPRVELGSARNSGNQGSAVLTAESIAEMDSATYEKNRPAIEAAIRRGDIR